MTPERRNKLMARLDKLENCQAEVREYIEAERWQTDGDLDNLQDTLHDVEAAIDELKIQFPEVLYWPETKVV